MRKDEKELQDKIAGFMSQFFIVEKEVWSVDKKSRIDLVMIHRTDISKEYPIGIEIKTDDKKTGSTLGQWLHQAHEYSTKEFQQYGKLMVCTYPQISEKCLSEGELMHKHNVFKIGDFACQNNVNTFLGQFDIGELQKYNYGNVNRLRIVFNARLIWDQLYNDFRYNNYKLICKR